MEHRFGFLAIGFEQCGEHDVAGIPLSFPGGFLHLIGGFGWHDFKADSGEPRVGERKYEGRAVPRLAIERNCRIRLDCEIRRGDGICIFQLERHLGCRCEPPIGKLFQKCAAHGRPGRKIGGFFFVGLQFFPRLGRRRFELAFQFLNPPLQVRAVHLDLRRERIIVVESFEIGVRCVVVIGIDAPLLEVGKESLHLIKILRRERIKLVVVALAATHRRAEPGARHGAHPVRGVFGEVFLWLRAAFAGHHVQTIEGRGGLLFDGRIREQVAGELLNRELIKRLVPVEGINDVIAVRKNILVLVAMVTDGVGEPHHIEPRRSHSFAEMRRGEQAVYLPLVGARAFVFEERVHFRRRWREADEIERKPPE